MSITVEVGGLSELLDALDPLFNVVTVGVASEGDPSDYALTWEFGQNLMIQSSPGPRTVWGTSGVGSFAIMSSQAPTGYIRINQEKFMAAVQKHMADVDWSDLAAIQDNIEVAMNDAAEECRDIIAAAAPVDTGALSMSFEIVPVGDELLETQDPAVLG